MKPKREFKANLFWKNGGSVSHEGDSIPLRRASSSAALARGAVTRAVAFDWTRFPASPSEAGCGRRLRLDDAAEQEAGGRQRCQDHSQHDRRAPANEMVSVAMRGALRMRGGGNRHAHRIIKRDGAADAFGQLVRQRVHVPATMTRDVIITIQPVATEHLAAGPAINLLQIHRRIDDRAGDLHRLPPGAKGDESFPVETGHQAEFYRAAALEGP